MQVLKDWAQADRDAYERLCEHRGCTCFISAPCVCCTHPGNPLNQESDNECWEEVFDLDEACEKAMERIKRQIDASVQRHIDEGRELAYTIGCGMYVRHIRLVKIEVAAHAAWKEYRVQRNQKWLKSHGVVL